MFWYIVVLVKFFLDVEGCFESYDGVGIIDDWDIDVWIGGMFMWCVGLLEVMMFNDYELSCGYSSCLLWDMDSGLNWLGGYVVLILCFFGWFVDMFI